MDTATKTTVQDAKSQVRAMLVATKLMDEKYGEKKSGSSNRNWAVTISKKGSWHIEYAEYVYVDAQNHWDQAGRLAQISLKLVSGESAALLITFSEHGRGEPPQDPRRWDIDSHCSNWVGPNAPPSFFTRSASKRDIDATEPCSPFVMGLIVRILNWFAQLPGAIEISPSISIS